MPLFIVLAADAADDATRRARHRDAHMAYWQGRAQTVKIAGAMIEEGLPVGSAFLLEADSKAVVHQLLADDPFSQEGVFQGEARIVEMRAAIGTWKPQA